jgi:hypothetical protein
VYNTLQISIGIPFCSNAPPLASVYKAPNKAFGRIQTLIIALHHLISMFYLDEAARIARGIVVLKTFQSFRFAFPRVSHSLQWQAVAVRKSPRSSKCRGLSDKEHDDRQHVLKTPIMKNIYVFHNRWQLGRTPCLS